MYPHDLHSHWNIQIRLLRKFVGDHRVRFVVVVVVVVVVDMSLLVLVLFFFRLLSVKITFGFVTSSVTHVDLQ